ncbi:hypothetical protein GCM10018787_05930 [Streptomyces thermodiastaticus]|nr:hypothetical protein GCM10018787_05930 [Streptomyces thermodiastaticus]
MEPPGGIHGRAPSPNDRFASAAGAVGTPAGTVAEDRGADRRTPSRRVWQISRNRPAHRGRPAVRSGPVALLFPSLSRLAG